MTADRTHYVYEVYDADGICLYVGCTGNPKARWQQHRTGNGDARGWFDAFIDHWRVSGPYPKPTALQIEKERISLRQPIWNALSDENRRYAWTDSRTLVNTYLAFHGVRFEPHPSRNRPRLVEARRRKSRKLRVVA